MRPLVFTAAALLALGGCATTSKPAASIEVETPPPSEQAWRSAITSGDAALIEALPSIWSKVLSSAKQRSGSAIAAEGALLDPDAALDHPELPPGSYECRVVRIGKGAGRRRFISFPSRFCYVSAEDKGLGFAKQTGSDLPTGYLYADGDKRYIFLGARQDAPGDASLGYGADSDRDVAGVVERVGAFRWRLVAPRDSGEGLDIYELTPVPADRQPS